MVITGTSDQSNNTGAIDVIMDGSVFEEKSSFKMLELTVSSELDWGSCIFSAAKSVSGKLEPWFLLWSFFAEVALYLYKSTIQSCMQYCCHIWVGAPSCYLELLDKLQKKIRRTVGLSLTACLESLAHCSQLKFFFYRCYWIYYFGHVTWLWII